MKRKYIRMRVDLDKPGEIVAVETGDSPAHFAKEDVAYEFAFYVRGMLANISTWSSLYLYVSTNGTRSGTKLMEKTITSSPLPGDSEAKLDASLTNASWADGSKRHALVPFSAAETTCLSPPGNATERVFWMAMRITTAEGRSMIIGPAKLTAYESGVDSSGAPEPGDPTYYTAAECDARFAKAIGGDIKFQRIPIYNPDQGRFQYLILRGEAGQEKVSIAND